MIKHLCHNLYLGSEALYVMSSFTQQSARIHGFASRDESTEIIFPARVSFPFSGVLEELVECAVLDLLEKSPTPGPSWPNCGSHGGAGGGSNEMVSPVLVGWMGF